MIEMGYNQAGSSQWGTWFLPTSIHSNLALGPRFLPRRLALKVRVVLRDEGGGRVGQAHLGVNSIHFRILTKILMKKVTKIFTKRLSKCIL